MKSGRRCESHKTSPFVWNHRQKFIIRFPSLRFIWSKRKRFSWRFSSPCYKSISHIASHKLPTANCDGMFWLLCFVLIVRGFGWSWAGRLRRMWKLMYLYHANQSKLLSYSCDREMIFFPSASAFLSQFSSRSLHCASQFARTGGNFLGTNPSYLGEAC